jgi:hypothetical protein
MNPKLTHIAAHERIADLRRAASQANGARILRAMHDDAQPVRVTEGTIRNRRFLGWRRDFLARRTRSETP